MSAFSVFFMQSPSFLAHQRDMKLRKGRSNAESLFHLRDIPSDNQIFEISWIRSVQINYKWSIGKYFWLLSKAKN